MDVINVVKQKRHFFYPAAHDPEAAPPLEMHSLVVKQVPLRLVLPVPPLKEDHQHGLVMKIVD